MLNSTVFVFCFDGMKNKQVIPIFPGSRSTQIDFSMTPQYHPCSELCEV